MTTMTIGYLPTLFEGFPHFDDIEHPVPITVSRRLPILNGQRREDRIPDGHNVSRHLERDFLLREGWLQPDQER
jgi:hypothetical protein